MRAPLAYVIRKTNSVKIYGDYPKYATPDDEIVTRNTQSVKEHTAEYKIDNRSVYVILDQTARICIHMSNSISP